VPSDRASQGELSLRVRRGGAAIPSQSNEAVGIDLARDGIQLVVLPLRFTDGQQYTGWRSECDAGAVHLFAPGSQRDRLAVLGARCFPPGRIRMVRHAVAGAEPLGLADGMDCDFYLDKPLNDSGFLG
jgi:hypothetical protein